MVKHEFYELLWKERGVIIFLTWFPSSTKMSKNDFIQHINVLNNLIDTNFSKILFIDATAFKAKIERSVIKELEYIKEQSSLKWILYTSHRKSMNRLLKRLKSRGIILSEYANRHELEQLFGEITEK